MTLLEPQARRSEVRLQITGSVGSTVLLDAGRIKQVFMNLILNAIQASPPTSVVTVRLRRIVQDTGDSVCRIEVQDNGMGIPADRRDDVFTPFFTTKSSGTGLGLAVAHQIVTEHGGEIEFTSEQNVGTTFVVAMPIAVEVEDQRVDRENTEGVCPENHAA